jgi:hypothetical protein
MLEEISTDDLRRLTRRHDDLSSRIAILCSLASRCSTQHEWVLRSLVEQVCAACQIQQPILGIRRATRTEASVSRFFDIVRLCNWRRNRAHHLMLLAKDGEAQFELMISTNMRLVEVVDIRRAPRIRFLLWVGKQVLRHFDDALYQVWYEVIVPMALPPRACTRARRLTKTPWKASPRLAASNLE